LNSKPITQRFSVWHRHTNAGRTEAHAAARDGVVDDTDLIAGARAGDRLAARRLYDRHAPRVYRLIFRMVGEDSLAQEYTQDTFVKAFAEKTNVPVATTMMGVGAFPETDPLSLRWLGMHGAASANWAVNGEYEWRKTRNDPMKPIAPGADLLLVSRHRSSPFRQSLPRDRSSPARSRSGSMQRSRASVAP
jgi:hypothetical protein